MKRFSSHAHVLQWIDRRVGVPVCFLLTMVRRLGGLFGRRGPVAPCRSVLFLKLAEQGSTVLAHEAIRTAVAHVGRENVCFLVFEENRFIVDLLGLPQTYLALYLVVDRFFDNPITVLNVWGDLVVAAIVDRELRRGEAAAGA